MSRAGTKKVGKTSAPKKPGLSGDEVEEIRQAFELFDTNGTGMIDPKELKAAMQSLGFDTKNPTIYGLIADLDTPDSEKAGGIDFDTFINAINEKLGDKESKEGIKRIFELFIDDPNECSRIGSQAQEDFNTTLNYDNFYDKVTHLYLSLKKEK